MDLEIENLNIPNNVVPFITPTNFVNGNKIIDCLEDDIGPIETKMRMKISKLKGCKYPDNFDWSIYDKIASRFEDGQPRGGVVFHTTFKLVNHHESCSKCLYAFELDTYGRGCIHDCKYCYAKEQLTTYGYWNRPSPMPVDVAEIRKILYTVFETDKPSKWREIIGKRTPLRIGSMNDSFMWLDTKYGVTKEVLNILKFYRYPYVVFTRSDLIAHDDYLEVIDKDLAAIQFSISGNTKLVRKLEPGAPSFNRRIKAIKRLREADIWTSVRINPLFPRYPDGYFTDPENIKERFGNRANVPILDLWNDDFVHEISESGIKSVLAGFVRLSHRSIAHVGQATDTPLREFFRPENRGGRGTSESKFTDKEIGWYYKYFRDEFKKNDVRFSTCYIGNGIKDYFQYQNLWDNKKDCCDIVGNVPTFHRSSQDINWETRFKFAPCRSKAETTKYNEEKMETNYTQAADTPTDVDL